MENARKPHYYQKRSKFFLSKPTNKFFKSRIHRSRNSTKRTQKHNSMLSDISDKEGGDNVNGNVITTGYSKIYPQSIRKDRAMFNSQKKNVIITRRKGKIRWISSSVKRRDSKKDNHNNNKGKFIIKRVNGENYPKISKKNRLEKNNFFYMESGRLNTRKSFEKRLNKFRTRGNNLFNKNRLTNGKRLFKDLEHRNSLSRSKRNGNNDVKILKGMELFTRRSKKDAKEGFCSSNNSMSNHYSLSKNSILKEVKQTQEGVQDYAKRLFRNTFKEVNRISSVYKKLEKIGKGSYAVAYSAQHKVSMEYCVLKTFKIKSLRTQKHVNRIMVNYI